MIVETQAQYTYSGRGIGSRHGWSNNCSGVVWEVGGWASGMGGVTCVVWVCSGGGGGGLEWCSGCSSCMW